MAPDAGVWVSVSVSVSVSIVMSVNNAMVNTHWPTAPFELTKGLSSPGLSLHLGENAIGITNKVASKFTATPCVNGVDSLASYILTTLW